MGLLAILRKLKKNWEGYRPLIEVLVYKDNILHNLKTFQTAYPRLLFAPVLKSNAYGHGLIEVAEILDGQGLPFFMVDSLFEARVLRNHGIKTPLLILGYTTAENINSQNLKNIAFGITNLEQLRHVSKIISRPISLHLKIDTGMRRQGIMPEELNEALSIIKNDKQMILEGICSHLADADGSSDEFSKKQIAIWNDAVALAESIIGKIKYKHLANSAGADLMQTAGTNVARLGLGLYGFNTSERKTLPLLPALEMQSIISSVRILKSGEGIGYGLAFTASREMKVATVPAGYTEGVDRRLSNAGAMTVGKTICPILGRVSMNITSIDISNATVGRDRRGNAGDVALNDSVTIFSKNPNDPNSIENIARLCDTIPYEILVKIPAYLKRTVI